MDVNSINQLYSRKYSAVSTMSDDRNQETTSDTNNQSGQMGILQPINLIKGMMAKLLDDDKPYSLKSLYEDDDDDDDLIIAVDRRRYFLTLITFVSGFVVLRILYWIMMKALERRAHKLKEISKNHEMLMRLTLGLKPNEWKENERTSFERRQLAIEMVEGELKKARGHRIRRKAQKGGTDEGVQAEFDTLSAELKPGMADKKGFKKLKRKIKKKNIKTEEEGKFQSAEADQERDKEKYQEDIKKNVTKSDGVDISFGDADPAIPANKKFSKKGVIETEKVGNVEKSASAVANKKKDKK